MSTHNPDLAVVILAAGKGTRMQSDTPKVLQTLAGQPFLTHVLNTARSLHPGQLIIVHGHGSEQLQTEYEGQGDISWAHQAEQCGTGHAVKVGLTAITSTQIKKVLVLYGDVPMIQARTLTDIVEAESDCTVLTATLENPQGYGRIVRDNNRLVSIVEQKDATDEQLAICEINTGILAAGLSSLRQWLNTINNDNAQQEYYLTDVIELAAEQGTVASTQPAQLAEIMGVNNRQQQAQLERLYQHQVAEQLMQKGIMLFDPARIDVRGQLECGRDVSIDINAVFTGHNQLGHQTVIEPNCTLHNVVIGDHVTIKANSVLEDCHIEDHAVVGPFARVRPGSKLGRHSRIGNFVEVKKIELGENSKVNHLSYVGDAIVGRNVNIGAGTITCNYDGVNKHQTTISDGAFVGSGTQLVAPVTVGQNATIGAGSTIRKSTPDGQLTLSIKQQKSIPEWQRPKK